LLLLGFASGSLPTDDHALSAFMLENLRLDADKNITMKLKNPLAGSAHQ